MKILKCLFLVLAVLLPSTTSMLFAAPRNMLPRFPEIIIEKGLSESFKVSECKANVNIFGTDAESSVEILLKNQGEKTLKSSVKFRILYPTSENQIRLKVNGKNVSYNRSSPRYEFELEPQKTISFYLSARQQINYSVESLRKALKQEEEENNKTSRKKFLMSDFSSLFEREKFGQRFMVGPLVSKWGVFPVEFENVSISVSVPSDFAMVTPKNEVWQKNDKGRNITFTTNSSEEFASAVFLPESEREEFIKAQKILTSEKFMH